MKKEMEIMQAKIENYNKKNKVGIVAEKKKDVATSLMSGSIIQ